jgi:predicted RNase H-like nuclease (RuvC/YqgF family)
MNVYYFYHFFLYHLDYANLFFFFFFFLQQAIKLVALYDQHTKYLRGYPQEVTELRTRVRSLECEVTQLRNLGPKVENLKKLLADQDKKLTENLRKQTLAEEKSWELTAQLGEWSWESTELQARLNDAEARCKVLSASSTLMRTNLCIAEEK